MKGEKMVDERFSALSFGVCGVDSEGAKKLADSLAEEIQNELHETIQTSFHRIIDRLNAMGHKLKAAYPPKPGDFSYRDDWKDESGYHCKLRVGLDVIVSTGYGHLLSDDEVLAPDPIYE